MTISTLPQIRVLPVGKPDSAMVKPYWHLFGCFPKTRDAYRVIRGYGSDPSVPPTEQEIAETIWAEYRGARVTDMAFCTDLALIYGSYNIDMVSQFRAARGRPRRAKRAA